MSNTSQWDADLTARDQRNIRPIKIYASLWAISFLAAVLFLPRGTGGIETQPVWAWFVAAIPVPLGALFAHYYLRFIRETDEMMRKIHLEALAAGFGVAFVSGLALIMLGELGMTRFGGLAWHLMLITYVWKIHMARREHSAQSA
jgi:hypothetical protein